MSARTIRNGIGVKSVCISISIIILHSNFYTNSIFHIFCIEYRSKFVLFLIQIINIISDTILRSDDFSISFFEVENKSHSGRQISQLLELFTKSSVIKGNTLFEDCGIWAEYNSSTSHILFMPVFFLIFYQFTFLESGNSVSAVTERRNLELLRQSISCFSTNTIHTTRSIITGFTRAVELCTSVKFGIDIDQSFTTIFRLTKRNTTTVIHNFNVIVIVNIDMAFSAVTIQIFINCIRNDFECDVSNAFGSD